MNPQNQDSSDHNCDAIIVGGGLIGGTMASALAQIGLSVAVLDRATPESFLDAKFDGRSSAIALASQRLLQSLDLWPGMSETACPIHDIRVSEADEPFFLHYDHREIGEAPFGYMVENRFIRKSLYAHLGAQSNVHLIAPVSVKTVKRLAGHAEVHLKDGRAFRAPLIIAADGRRSKLRADASIRVTSWDYDQAAIVCTVRHEKPHHNIAHEHFLPVGPFAILPLKDNRASLVWTENTELTPKIMALEEKDFLRELEKRFGDFLGKLEVVGPRWSYPLSLQHARSYIANRLAVIGDAAHGLHPIAGQGLNLGYRDVAVLAEVIADTRRLGLDYGHESVLENYERWRRFDNTLMLAMTDGLNRLFSNSFGPIKMARDIGLSAVNGLPFIKKVFMNSATGLAGDVPKLMRGESL